MKQLVTKRVSSVVFGESHAAKFIYNRLRETKKDALLLGRNDELRFISRKVLSINGVKTQVEKVLVDVPEEERIVLSSHGATVIIGSNGLAMRHVFSALRTAKSVSLISQESKILHDYDLAVQDVVLRFLKKSKVRLLLDTELLSANEREAKNYIIAERGGLPKRIVADTLITAATEAPEVEDSIGLHNVVSAEKLSLSLDIRDSCSLTSDIGILKSSQPLCLSDVDLIVEFLKSKKRYFNIRKPTVHITSAGGYTIFSIGIIEQSITGAHTGYRKSVIKLPKPSPDQPTYFIKVIASTNGRLLGVSGVVPESSFDLNLLSYFIENKSSVSTAKTMIFLSSPSAGTLLEALDSL